MMQAKQCRWYTKSCAFRTTCIGGIPCWHDAHFVPKRLQENVKNTAAVREFYAKTDWHALPDFTGRWSEWDQPRLKFHTPCFQLHQWIVAHCINRISSCCGEKGKKKTALECISVNDRPVHRLMDGSMCSVLCVRGMFACLCVCRWSTESRGGGGSAHSKHTLRRTTKTLTQERF